MSWMRPLGSTGLEVSALGLGTVKLGRDQDVKYPQGFTIPDERSARFREMFPKLVRRAIAKLPDAQRERLAGMPLDRQAQTLRRLHAARMLERGRQLLRPEVRNALLRATTRDDALGAIGRAELAEWAQQQN